GKVAIPSSLVPSFEVQCTTRTSPRSTLVRVLSPSLVILLRSLPLATATFSECVGSTTENARTSGDEVNAGKTGNPDKTPPGQWYAVSNLPSWYLPISVTTPR